MSITVNFKQLWEEGGYGKDNPLENSLAYVSKVAKQLGADQAVADLIVAETFLRLAEGTKFSTDKCPCGCGIDKSGTAITHHMVNRLKAVHKEVIAAKQQIIETRIYTSIEDHVRRENEKFIADNLTPTKMQRLWAYLNKPLFSKPSLKESTDVSA